MNAGCHAPAGAGRTGSVTAAAQELHYSQPSVSHHLARLEAETGAQLLQRVGRGIRLTEAGRVLAGRATEILGRIDAAALELSAHVGLQAGKVRVAAFASALLTLVPRVTELLAGAHPGLQLELVETHPAEALQLLRSGEVDLTMVRHGEIAPEDGFRLTYLFDDVSCLVFPPGSGDTIDAHRDAAWIAGCAHHRGVLLALCADAGFVPRIVCTTDDIATVQSLVAGRLGVAVIPGLALEGYRHPGVGVREVPGTGRPVYAATFGAPPDPPPTRAVLGALESVGALRRGPPPAPS